MPTAPPPEQPDLSLLLPRSTYWHLIHTLQTSLPPPASDCPEALAHRNHAAIAEIASMLPANADETSIAARCVAAHAQAMDCLRLARQCPDDPSHVLKCNAQSASMMRQANAARALLVRVQAARRRREADAASCDQDAWTEHCAVGLMGDAMRDAAPQPPLPTPAPDPQSGDGDLTEAEHYAFLYPRRAALIRSLGRVPDPCGFGPPSAELVEAIVTGTSPILLDLDRQPDLVPA